MLEEVKNFPSTSSPSKSKVMTNTVTTSYAAAKGSQQPHQYTQQVKCDDEGTDDAQRQATSLVSNQTNAVNNNNNIEMDQLSRVPHDEDPPD